jgi:hypothetical protein
MKTASKRVIKRTYSQVIMFASARRGLAMSESSKHGCDMRKTFSITFDDVCSTSRGDLYASTYV